MIPERMPPPLDAPVGWSPNALAPTAGAMITAVTSPAGAAAMATAIAATQADAQKITISGINGPFFMTKTVLSAAQIRNLSSASQIVTPPGGANTLCVPLMLSAIVRRTLNYSASPSWDLRLPTLFDQALMTITPALASTGENKLRMTNNSTISFSAAQITASTNQGLRLSATANVTGGDGDAIVTVMYCIVPLIP